MKAKNKLILACALLLSLGFWWFSRGPTARPNPMTNINGKKAPAVAAAENPNARQLPQSPSPSAKYALPPGFEVVSVADLIASPSGHARIQQFQQQFDGENSKLLDFYGEVVDQNGAPVPNVKVKAGVGLYVSVDQSGGKDYFTESDGKGRFSFVGIHGAGVGFTLTKDGYVYDQTLLSSSRPNDYLPDANNPTIFRMWKLKGAEPMVHWQLNRIGLTVDGTANSFDLLAGQRSRGTGDIVVQFARTPLTIEQGKPFNWVLTLQIPTGGFAETTGTYPNEAPSDGYKPTITITMAASSKNWTPLFDHSYYFTARNGQVFGRMTVHLVGDYVTPPTHFELEVYANPSGSRNLEFDEAKQIKP